MAGADQMIINLRGTSAAGKTTIVRRLIEKHDSKPLYGFLGWRQPEAIKLARPKRDLFALGPYPASGCDAVVSALGVKGVLHLLEKYSARGDIVFESLIVSSMFGAVGAWLRDHPPAIIAVLDVTLAEARAGLSERQGNQQRTAKTQKDHHYRTLRTADRMRAAGMDIRMLARDGAPQRILEWL
jgi:thymidylate kinase